ncbi:MPPED1 [Symbiodinium natans]|uniref:MPPED1 protein n=1 Tax=Symbiodinium natans TaxID=878477 RepID=A0A812RFP3_9DINO|nr:MPPED1 [Symbiodinium natans]
MQWMRWGAVAAAALLGLTALAAFNLRGSAFTLRLESAETTETRRLSTQKQNCGEEQPPPPGGQCEVTILHISDTHNLHRAMSQAYPMPTADIMLHTGDISDHGEDWEIGDFNEWIGEIKHKYKYGVYFVSGNHDWMSVVGRVAGWQMAPEASLDPHYLQSKVPNARLLHHEVVEVAGLKIYGSDWCPWFGYTSPGDWWNMEWNAGTQRIFEAWKQQAMQHGGANPVPTHRYFEIPAGTDILMSHQAPWDVFDQTMTGNWGSSKDLRSRVEAVGAKVHLFGHIHEARGEWQRCDQHNPAVKAYCGGAEYEPIPGQKFGARAPPYPGYPTDLIMNNAQMNNQLTDQAYTHWMGPAYIKAPGKLITAKWSGGQWHFTAVRTDTLPPQVNF